MINRTIKSPSICVRACTRVIQRDGIASAHVADALTSRIPMAGAVYTDYGTSSEIKEFLSRIYDYVIYSSVHIGSRTLS